LLAYADSYYDVTREAWSDGPAKKDHQKLLFGCLEAIKVLQGHDVDLAVMIGGYMTRVIVPTPPLLVQDDHRKGPIHGVCDRRSPTLGGLGLDTGTTSRPWWPEWPPTDLLPMLLDIGMVVLVSLPLISLFDPTSSFFLSLADMSFL
jgi:hypothetical protein